MYTERKETTKLKELAALSEQSCRDYRAALEEGRSPQAEELQEAFQRITELLCRLLEAYHMETDRFVCGRSLLVIMDACEIIPDDGRLHTALDLAGELLPGLPDCPLKCKLWMYCYYYTEDIRCAQEAKRIMESWDKSVYNAERSEALDCYEMLM